MRPVKHYVEMYPQKLLMKWFSQGEIPH